MQTSISFNKTPICLPSRICFYHCISHVVGTRPFSCADINSNLILYFPDAFVFLSLILRHEKAFVWLEFFQKLSHWFMHLIHFFLYMSLLSLTLYIPSHSLNESYKCFLFFSSALLFLLQLLHWFLLQDNSKKLSKFTYEIISFSYKNCIVADIKFMLLYVLLCHWCANDQLKP